MYLIDSSNKRGRYLSEKYLNALQLQALSECQNQSFNHFEYEFNTALQSENTPKFHEMKVIGDNEFSILRK